MSIFDAYDEEYTSLTQQITKKISDVSTYESDADKKGSAIRLIDGLIQQANDLVKQMEVEVRSQDNAATKRQMQGKIAQYKTTLQSLSRDFKTVREREEADDLFGGGRDGIAQNSRDHRARLQDQSDRLGRQNDTIDNARRVIAETEDVALEIVGELGRNREKIESAHSKVRQVTGMTERARRVIRSMTKREVQQRFMMYGIALLLLGAIALVIYYAVR